MNKENQFILSAHIHSCYSVDSDARDKHYLPTMSDNTYSRIISYAIKHNIDAVMITDNNNDQAFYELKDSKNNLEFLRNYYHIKTNDKYIKLKHIGTKKELILIKGIELKPQSLKNSNKTGHFVVFGYEGSITNIVNDALYKEVFNDENDLYNLLTKLKQKNATIIATHPFATNYGGIRRDILIKFYKKNSKLIDGIDVFNALNNLIPSMKKNDIDALNFAYKFFLMKFYSADAHLYKNIKDCQIIFNKNNLNFSSGDKFIESIKNELITESVEVKKHYTSRFDIFNWVFLKKLKSDPKRFFIDFIRIFRSIILKK